MSLRFLLVAVAKVSSMCLCLTGSCSGGSPSPVSRTTADSESFVVNRYISGAISNSGIKSKRLPDLQLSSSTLLARTHARLCCSNYA